MKLYHCVSARSFRPLWALEELGLTYELSMLPFPPRVHKRDFLAVNPLGTVPAFLDGEVLMTESVAICEYLAARYGSGTLAVVSGEIEFGRYLDWLHRGEATFTFPQTLVLRYGRFEPIDRRQPQVADDYTRWFLSRLRSLEIALAQRTFVCADRFTAADISVGYALMLAEYIGISERLGERTVDYWTDLKDRPAFKRALERQEAAAAEQGVPKLPSPLT